MNKDIDAEKLITEIKRLIKVNKELKSSRFTEGIAAGYGDVLSAIVSFQQDKETLDLCSKIWWEEQGWIMIPPDVTVEGIDSLLRQVKKKLQQEQPEVDLEKEIEEWLKAGPITDTRYDDYCDADIQETARHFYELGLNARKL